MRRRRRHPRGIGYESEDAAATRFLDADLEVLEASLRPFSIAIDSAARERILLFSRELIAWNDRLNLLSRSDAPNVIRKHVAASAAVFLAVPHAARDRWIDVGTGAGFPGLVLKILRPEMDITLLDSARKRCLFLESVIRQMEIGRTPVLPLRVETLVARGEMVGAFEVLTARAVASLPDTLRGFGPLVAPGGRLVTFKGPQWHEELETTRTSGTMDAAGFEVESSLRIPWTAGHLITLRRRSDPRER